MSKLPRLLLLVLLLLLLMSPPEWERAAAPEPSPEPLPVVQIIPAPAELEPDEPAPHFVWECEITYYDTCVSSHQEVLELGVRQAEVWWEKRGDVE